MTKIKGHHYITESYQKGFTDKNGHVWVLTDKGKVFNTNPENTFKENHFYTVSFPNKGATLVVENTLSEIEGAFIGVMKNKIEKGLELSAEDKARVALFAVGMFSRTKVQREHFRDNFQKMIQQMEEMEAHMKSVPNPLPMMDHGNGPSITLDDLKERMKNFDSYESISTIELSQDLAPMLFDMDWTIFEAPADETFISSDNPLCMCSPEREKLYGRGAFGASAGLRHADVEVTFPLSSCFALFANWGGKGDNRAVANVSVLQQFNLRTTRSAHNLFADNRAVLDGFGVKETPSDGRHDI